VRTIPAPKKNTLPAVVKGQYKTSNKKFFKGRAITEGDLILDVSVYAEKELQDKDLQGLTLSVTFDNLEQANKLKQKK
jgi:hypothetical protein